MAALCAIDEDEELAILVADTVCKQVVGAWVGDQTRK